MGQFDSGAGASAGRRRLRASSADRAAFNATFRAKCAALTATAAGVPASFVLVGSITAAASGSGVAVAIAVVFPGCLGGCAAMSSFTSLLAKGPAALFTGDPAFAAYGPFDVTKALVATVVQLTAAQAQALSSPPPPGESAALQPLLSSSSSTALLTIVIAAVVSVVGAGALGAGLWLWRVRRHKTMIADTQKDGPNWPWRASPTADPNLSLDDPGAAKGAAPPRHIVSDDSACIDAALMERDERARIALQRALTESGAPLAGGAVSSSFDKVTSAYLHLSHSKYIS